MTLNRREMLRLGAMGAAGAMLSSAACSTVLPSMMTAPQKPGVDPLAPLPTAAKSKKMTKESGTAR